jgi:hypothetical protein
VSNVDGIFPVGTDPAGTKAGNAVIDLRTHQTAHNIYAQGPSCYRQPVYDGLFFARQLFKAIRD